MKMCSKQVDRCQLITMINNGEDVTDVDTSQITDMSFLFKNNKSFNQDIGSWDVSNVTDMGFMFNSTTDFNQDIGSWDVSNVRNMAGLLMDALAFDKPLPDWDLSNVEVMTQMLHGSLHCVKTVKGYNLYKFPGQGLYICEQFKGCYQKVADAMAQYYKVDFNV